MFKRSATAKLSDRFDLVMWNVLKINTFRIPHSEFHIY